MQQQAPSVTDARLVEYSALRDELIQGGELIAQASNIALPASGGLVAFGVLQQNPVALIAAAAVLLASLSQVLYQFEAVIRDATYIYVAIEEPHTPGLRWEHNVVNLRKSMRARSWLFFNDAVPFLYVLGVGGCVLLAAYIVGSAHNLPVYDTIAYGVSSLGLLVWLGFAACRAAYVNSQHFYMTYRQRWEDLLNLNNSSAPSAASSSVPSD